MFGAAQTVAAPSAAWLSMVIGTRRFLLWTSVIFALTSLTVPFTRDYGTIIALQVVRGLAVGAFIPASLGFILRNLAPRWWIWGLAAYAFRFVFSQNIAGSLEAFYSEGGAWQWIFWQNAVLTPVMTALVWYAMQREGVNRYPVASDRLARPYTCRDWPRHDLCGARSGQPPRLAEFG